MQVNDIFYSPPRGQGRPSLQQQAARLERQRAREEYLAQQTQPQPQQRPPASSTATTPESPPQQRHDASSTATTLESQSQPNPPLQRRHRYRTFSVAFKLHVVEYAQRNSIRATARHFGLDRKQVRGWLDNRTKYETENRQTTRFRVSRDAVGQHSAMEAQLYDFILDERAAGRCVTGGMIRQEALRLLPDTNFQASNGWLTRFLRRKHLSFRRITTSGRDLPSNAGENVRLFLGSCEPFLEPGFDRDMLLNGDETTIYIDPPTTASYAPIGSRRVEAITSGQQKTRVSVCFTAAASGKKCKPLILLPRKNPLKNWVPPSTVVIAYGTSGNFNETVISGTYIPQILVAYKNEHRFRNLHFLFDQAPCHVTKQSKASFASASIDVKWIPKRMTPFLQPADQSWMRPLKLSYQRKWNNWMRTAPKAYTPAGNLKSPGYARVVEWIAEAWDELDPNLIARSFKYCGVTSNNMAESLPTIWPIMVVNFDILFELVSSSMM